MLRKDRVYYKAGSLVGCWNVLDLDQRVTQVYIYVQNATELYTDNLCTLLCMLQINKKVTIYLCGFLNCNFYLD